MRLFAIEMPRVCYWPSVVCNIGHGIFITLVCGHLLFVVYKANLCVYKMPIDSLSWYTRFFSLLLTLMGFVVIAVAGAASCCVTIQIFVDHSTTPHARWINYKKADVTFDLNVGKIIQL